MAEVRPFRQPERDFEPRRVRLYAPASLRLRRRRGRRPRLRPDRLSVLLVALGAGVALLAAGWGLAGWAAHGSAAGPAGPPAGGFATLVVAPGDTLWGIAERHAPADVDLRWAVHQLQQWNRLASPALSVGQRLLLPAAWLEGR